MSDGASQPIAIVGVGAIMPDAPNANTFWGNISAGRYSISDVPAARWSPELYYDPDPRAPYKTYSRIGGWVREFHWDPLAWKLPVPPAVAVQLDDGQKWSIAAARAALLDAGWPQWTVDPDRVAVIIGNAIGGEKHYDTNLHIEFPAFVRTLRESAAFSALPRPAQEAMVEQARAAFFDGFPGITEDTMPGELANIIAGRVANLFNLRGPNFTTDAACASGLAATYAAVRGLQAHDFDAVVTGGVDRNMGVAAFVKFCKIGALSATGTRPFDVDADGFVMGEGAALFVLKRLADAERDGDRIYAVLLGIASSSDGRGKGITAPNPVGQRLAVERAWDDAGISPASASCVEAHGTSTRVGDATELAVLSEVFRKAGAAPRSTALGSVKSNVGHLKAAAGAAGLFKMVMSLSDKVLAPSLNFVHPNPNVDWDETPFRVTTALREWPAPPAGSARTGGVSAFGFGGTNFHAVLQEYVPGRYRADAAARSFVVSAPALSTVGTRQPATWPKPPLRGAAVVGGRDETELAEQLDRLRAQAQAGQAPGPARPDPALAAAPVRVAIDFADAAELAVKAGKALAALRGGNGAMWRMLRAQGVFLGRGPAPKVAFLFTGQGSQYVNMLRPLSDVEPIVARTFGEADRIMTPLLGRPLTSYIFVEAADDAAMREAENQLLQTEITQPAVLTADLALTDLLAAYGVRPDMVMGHSLGEYGALVAAGALSFDAALEAVSARGREMAHLTVEDTGAMAAVFGPLVDIERIVAAVDGYVIVANINSTGQAVVGGSTVAVERAVTALQGAGLTARRIPVSHAFHTSIVAPVSGPLTDALRRLDLRPPVAPIVSNVTGQFYPADADTQTVLDLLGRQVAAPVQFVAGLRTLYDAGARVFVEVGPKRALHGFVEDVLGTGHDDVIALFTNHPKLADDAAFNQALCGLYAAGLGYGAANSPTAITTTPDTTGRPDMTTAAAQPAGRPARPVADPAEIEPVVVTGAALGLPGAERVFDDDNIGRILDGEQLIDTVPHRLRRAMVDQSITRLVKADSGEATFATIDDESEVIKLAGRRAPFDLVAEFGVDAARDGALDTTTRLAVGAGFDALRDAGLPLVMHYKTTTLGTLLPDRWGLPESMRDDTGVVFASAFPGYDSFAHDLEGYFTERGRRAQLQALEGVRARLRGDEPAAVEADRQITRLRHELAAQPYRFDRRFLFRCLSMGHSQFAEIIGARGPNTQVNAACASTALAFCVAEDWIHSGRCRRVIVLSADDATSDALLPWVGSGFLASGAAATDDLVEQAATPFDRRRHGMIVGMGAAAFVIESAESARERGIRPICEVLGAVAANSAYHGTRLDVEHIGQVMEEVVRQAETRGVDRHAIAAETMFVSHETYTPARGGSAAAEINALRRVFGTDADCVLITNTKGFTGHAMGAGIEDAVAVKALETGIVPPVPNFREPDPDLGPLNLSTGGARPIRYGLRLAAGFGSQIAMTLLRWVPTPGGQRPAPSELGYAYRVDDPVAWQRWLDAASGRSGALLEVAQRRLRVVDAHGVDPAAVPVATPPISVKPIEPVTVSVAPIVVGEPAAVATPPEPATPAPAAPPAPVPIAEPAAQPAPGPAAGSGPDGITDQVVQIVSELTGYPPELLDPELDLEADLGVDTVKQAEVFATVRQRFDLARDDNLRLRDFPTLNHVVGWIRERTTTSSAPSTSDTSGIGTGAATSAQPAPGPAAGSSPDQVTGEVTRIVSELTGYPPELLDPELDLEADLGVDTVKQAEVFATVRQRFDLARDDNLRLRDFPTLNHVIGWIRERISTPSGPSTSDTSDSSATSATAEPWPEATDPAVEPALTGDIAATDRVPRRVPVPALRPDLSLCAPTGAHLGSGSRIVVVLDEGGVGGSLVARLRRLGADVLTVEPATPTDDLLGRIDDWRGAAAVHGVYGLAALDDEGPLDALDIDGWGEALRRRVGVLSAVMRRLYADAPFLVTGTRLGGRHGYDDAGATCPLGGAVTGFAKAYGKERPGTVVKAVDFAFSRKTAALADRLVDETLRDPGCVEVGYADGLRWGVGLASRPFGEETGGMVLSPQTVFLVTGAAGSIVSAIAADLARASGGTFHLLDVTPAPEADDDDLRRYVGDRDGLKLDLAARMRDRGERPTPVAIDRELAALERRQAALAAIRAVELAGGRAHYHRVDLIDGDAVAKVLAEVHGVSERIDVLLHAAGLEISHALPDKDPNEFDRVFGVKADGWFNLLSAAKDLPIGATVVFSSVAGRFGNAGQTDYSAANDLLCKVTSNLRRTRPGTRAIAVDWTAWAGIGMATRGSIPAVMAAAGVEMLPPQAGIAWIRRELTGTEHRGEVIVAGALGALAAPSHSRGGLADTAFAPAGYGPMVGEVAAADVHSGLVIRTTLDPAVQPFLRDHRIEGTAVLPGVMGMEAFAEAARLFAPGWEVIAIEDVDFLAPVKFYRDEPRTVTITALVRPAGDELVAECRLEADRLLAGADTPQRTIHFTGTVRLARQTAQPETATLPATANRTVSAEGIYRLYFHGPAYQVVESAWRLAEGTAGRFAGNLPANHEPAAEPLMTGPRLIELCFQVAGLHEVTRSGQLGLPKHVDLVRLPERPIERDGLIAVAHPAGDAYRCAVVDPDGRMVVRLDGYRTVALPQPIAPEVLGPFQAI